jgi:hypothetical protein
MKSILALLLSSVLPLSAQGPLLPPSTTPAPSMKSLDQIEARTPIGSLPFAISTSGSYYLTGNLTFTAPTGDAIAISVGDVTLDLNGFTLKSAAAVTGPAISISGGTANVTVKNGNIAGNSTVAIAGTPPSRTWTATPAGFQHGIDDSSTGAHFFDLNVRGCRSRGIFSYSPGQAIVERVSCVSNGAGGILAESGCVIGCTVRGNAIGGISAPNGSVSNCVAINNGSDGICAAGGNIANCTSSGNANDGVDQVTAYSLAVIQSNVAQNTGTLDQTTAALAQIEPRTPIPKGPITPIAGPHFTISAPGSYFLTGNFTVTSGDAIRITSDDVTLDLNGFTIKSTASPASGEAVAVYGVRRNITVCNGHIRGGTTYNPAAAGAKFTGPGFWRGIFVFESGSTGIRVRDITVSNCEFDGIIATNASVVENCLVETVGGRGVGGGIVTNCRAATTGQIAIYSEFGIVSHCEGVSVGNAYGIQGHDVSHSRGVSAGGGIYASVSVSNCSGTGVTGNGITGAIVSYSDGATGNTPGTFTIDAHIAIGCTKSGLMPIDAPGGKYLGTP